MKKSLSILLALVMVLALCPVFASAEATYAEAPSLAAKVEAGELPPVTERIPANPNILEVTEIGAYGGTWRQAVTAGTFNHAHHHVTGYLNSNALIWNVEKTEVVPSYISEYTFNEDYTEFSFTLREGLKWSDGEPVTTEDAAFRFNDFTWNTDLSPTDSYYADCTLTIVDELTWKLNFETPKPLYINYWAYNDNSNFVLPAHYLKQFHAAYVSEEKMAEILAAEGFEDWVLMFEDKRNDQKNMELPVLGPWLLNCDPAETNTITFVRNPYYWAVDQNGQQLPYIDEAVISIVESTDLVNSKIIAGEVDVQVACVQESFSNYPLFAQYAEEMGYHIEVSEFNEPNAMNFAFNATSVDPVKAPYLTNKDFRKAMSIALDRETIISTFYSVGPYKSEIAQTALLEASPWYNEEAAKGWTEFDAEKANAMLDELGMTSYDKNGYRMTANGEEFALVITCPSYDDQWIEVAEMVANQWRENVKINVTANEVDPSLWNERTTANDFDITNLTGNTGGLYLTTGMVNDLTGYASYGWGVRFMPGAYIKEGDGVFTPTAEIERLWELGNLILSETDAAKTAEYIKEITDIRADQMYYIGIGRRLPAINIIKDNFHNVSNLDQDWGYGFCGSSRADGYWVAE